MKEVIDTKRFAITKMNEDYKMISNFKSSSISFTGDDLGTYAEEMESRITQMEDEIGVLSTSSKRNINVSMEETILRLRQEVLNNQRLSVAALMENSEVLYKLFLSKKWDELEEYISGMEQDSYDKQNKIRVYN